ncbi:MAG: choice-of-anchor D domain-containing protein [Bacteroidales bacterium]|nr:choice-of-anchor D domain-containing protein [Bacteroidales bacterium]
MKHTVFTLILILTTAVSAANKLTITSSDGKPKDTVNVSVQLANTDTVTALQIMIPLNPNLTYAENSCILNALRSDSHVLYAAVSKDTLKIYVYSLSLKPLKNSDGEIVQFKLILGSEPGTYKAEAVQVKLSSAEGKAKSCTVKNASIKILAPKLQIVSDTLNFGHIPIRKQYTKTLSLKNTGTQALTVSSVQFDDTVYSCAFSPMTINAGASKNLTVKYSPVKSGKALNKVSVYSDGVNGMQQQVLAADAYSVNELHLLSALGYNDSVITLQLKMNNMDSVAGLQTNIVMPAALQYVENSFKINQARKTNHIAYAGLNNDTLSLLIYSPDNSAVKDTDGVIATFDVLLHGSGGYYYPKLVQTAIADKQANNVVSAVSNASIQIRSGKISCSSSLDLGTLSVKDTAKQTLSIYNSGNATLKINSAVFTQEGYFVKEALPFEIEQGKSKTLTVCAYNQGEGNFTCQMNIYSSDAQNPMKPVQISLSRYEPNHISLAFEDTLLASDDIKGQIVINNYSTLTAIQTDIGFPAWNYTLDPSDFTLTSRSDNHTLNVVALNDSTYRLLVFSMQNNAVKDTSGALVEFSLSPKDTNLSGKYKMTIKNTVLGDKKGVNKLTEGKSTFNFVTFAKNYVIDTVKKTICEGGKTEFHGSEYSQSGDYSYFVHTTLAADTLYVLSLTVGKTYNQTFFDTIVLSEKGEDYSDTVVKNNQTYLGCDSVTTVITRYDYDNTVDTVYKYIAAEKCNGESYQLGGKTFKESGTYYDTVNVNKYRDSITVLSLTINPVYSITLLDTIKVTDKLGTDKETVIIDTLQTVKGCDSIITKKTWWDYVDEKQTVKHEYSQSICSNETYQFGGKMLFDAGLYTDTIEISEVKDSIVYLNLTVNTAYDTTVFDTIKFNVKGEDYSDTTVTENQTFLGCDSVVTVIKYYDYDNSVDTVYKNIDADVCQGGTYVFGGKTLSQSGTYYDTVNVNKYLDSITVLTFTVNPVYNTLVFDTIVLSEKGEDYSDTVVNNNQTYLGCDSVVTLITYYDYDNTVDTVYGYTSATACSGETYDFNGKTLKESGTYYDTVNVNKYLDSITVLSLTINPVYNTFVYDTVLIEQTGENYSDTVLLQTLQSVDGCDSSVTKITYYQYQDGNALIQVQQDNTLLLYPNPANEKITLQMTPVNHSVQIQITDNSGKTVKTVELKAFARLLTIDVSDLKNGVYYLRTEGKTLKWIKQ